MTNAYIKIILNLTFKWKIEINLKTIQNIKQQNI